jgi:acetyl esterase/lipase
MRRFLTRRDSRWHWCLVLGSLVWLAGCGADPASPPESGPSALVRTRLNEAYAAISPDQRLDLYLPPTGDCPFPLVVWMHGGSWAAGSKDLAAGSVQRRLTARGFAVASVQYRLSGVARYPAAVNDVKAAVRFLRASATRFGINPERIAVWGSSAGAHLATMVALSPGAAAFDESSLGNPTVSSRVQAVVNWFGPSDLLVMNADGAAQGCPLFNGIGHDAINSAAGQFFGARPSSVPAIAREASPATWVSVDDPPMLLQHGALDCTVPIQQGRRLRDALRGVMDPSRVEWTELASGGHGGAAFESAANMGIVESFLGRWLR